MITHNEDIAALFDQLANILEIEDANPFRIRAYRNAARTIRQLPQELSELVEQGADLSELPTIGKDLARKIAEIVHTGNLQALENETRNVPLALVQLTRLPGLGPKRVKRLFQELNIKSEDDLRKAAQAGKIHILPGFGEQTEARILEAIAAHAGQEHRVYLDVAEQVGRRLLDRILGMPGVTRATIAGSYRRRRETVGDLDILVTCQAGSPFMDRFTSDPEVLEVVSRGTTRSTVILHSGLQVDLRVLADENYGSGLHYFTGSRAHNIAIRRRAIRMGLKINEYGVFKGEKRIAGETEEQVFKAVGLPYIEPELRENRGEIEAAQRKALPRLVKQDQILGDLHCHSKASDGHNSLREMALAAKALGYRYLAITDHSSRLRIAHGLDAKRLARQLDEIDRLNEEFQGFQLLKSSEVDILEDGSLDLSDDILERLDLTVCSIHFKFDLPVEQQTDRIIRAMDHPAFNILGHPSGRLIGEREPIRLNMERLMTAARDRGCFLEVNGQPKRLDLTDTHCRMAKELGVRLAFGSDAHSTEQLDYMHFCLGQARRGWLEPRDVINCLSLTELRRLLKRA